MSARAVVFANGEFVPGMLDHVHELSQCDVWCADGGLVHANVCGLNPDVIIGDCDSVPAATLDAAVAAGATLKSHPPNKNASDLELTMLELLDAGYEDVTLLGVSGGRLDHALFNWLLVLQQDWPYRLTVIDDTVTAHLVHANRSFEKTLPSKTTVSLLARDSVSGVTTQGLSYPLTDARLMGGRTLGLSNEVVDAEPGHHGCLVKVSVQSSRLLVCVVHSSQ